MKKAESRAENRFFGSISALIILAVVADLVDFGFYIRYLRGLGIGWTDSASWSQQLAYFKTPIGATLTTLGIAPYLIAILWVNLHRPK